MSERKRDDSGRYVETVTAEDVLDALRSMDDTVVTAKEVAEAVGCSSDSARQKLVELHEDGVVERKEVGARAVVWWLDEERSHDINPEDPFWDADAGRSDEKTDASKVDEYLYGA
ncbi:MAG: FaeA/PapI family transcriptional regulator [Halobacteriales archaeon]|nr:FaeA/PapI family transcriptional regulator [Halobacteriales archaeon]